MESVPLSVCTKYKKNILVTVSIKYEMSVRETRQNWRKSHENVLDPVTISPQCVVRSGLLFRLTSVQKTGQRRQQLKKIDKYVCRV